MGVHLMASDIAETSTGKEKALLQPHLDFVAKVEKMTSELGTNLNWAQKVQQGQDLAKGIER